MNQFDERQYQRELDKVKDENKSFGLIIGLGMILAAIVFWSANGCKYDISELMMPGLIGAVGLGILTMAFDDEGLKYFGSAIIFIIGGCFLFLFIFVFPFMRHF